MSKNAYAMLMSALFSFGASEYERQVLYCFGLKYSIGEELVIKYCRVEDEKLEKQRLPFRKGDKSSQDGLWLPVWRELKNKPATLAILSPCGTQFLMYDCIIISADPQSV